MTSSSVKLTGDWDAWEKTIDPARLKRYLDFHIRKATIDNCMYVIRKIKDRIKGRKYEPNSPLTILLKGSGMPLVDHNDLVKFISHQMINSFEAYVGAKKSLKGVNIAEVLHEGVAIKVTPKMRRWFAIAISEAIKKGAPAPTKEGLGGSPSVINIPGRPFIRSVIESPQVQARVRRRWEKGFKDAIFGDTKVGK